MPFDVEGALQAGSNEAEVAAFLADKHNFDMGAARRSNVKDNEIVDFLKDRDIPVPVAPAPAEEARPREEIVFPEGLTFPVEDEAAVQRARAEVEAKEAARSKELAAIIEEKGIDSPEGLTAFEEATEKEGLIQPFIDPTEAVGVGIPLGLKAAKTLALKGAPKVATVLTNIASTLTGDVAIGVALEGTIGEDSPASLPVALALGFLSGATLERSIENVLEAAASRAGRVGTLNAAAVKAAAEKIAKGDFSEPDSLELAKAVMSDEVVSGALAKTAFTVKNSPELESNINIVAKRIKRTETEAGLIAARRISGAKNKEEVDRILSSHGTRGITEEEIQAITRPEILEGQKKFREFQTARAEAKAVFTEVLTLSKQLKKGTEVELARVKTEEAAKAARHRLSSDARFTFRSGLDPSQLVDLATVGLNHLERGARGFTKWADRMINDFGPDIRPFLRGIWDDIKTGVISSVEKAVIKPAQKVKDTAVNLLRSDEGFIANPFNKKTDKENIDIQATKLAKNPELLKLKKENNLSDADFDKLTKEVAEDTIRKLKVESYDYSKPATKDTVDKPNEVTTVDKPLDNRFFRGAHELPAADQNRLLDFIGDKPILKLVNRGLPKFYEFFETMVSVPTPVKLHKTMVEAATEAQRLDSLTKRTMLVSNVDYRVRQDPDSKNFIVEEVASDAFNPLRGGPRITPMKDEMQSIRFLRSLAKGRAATIERSMTKLYDDLGKFSTQTNEHIFEYLDGRLDLNGVEEIARPMAKRLRSMLDAIGKELVKRDMITQEAFDSHNGNYVHYMISSKILGKGSKVSIGATGKQDRTTLQSRNKDLTDEQRRTMGWVENAQLAVPRGIGKTLNALVKQDYLQTVADNPAWTWQGGRVRVAGKSFSIGQLKTEIDAMKEAIVGASRKGSGQDVDAMQGRLDELTTALGKVDVLDTPVGYLQMPENKNFGPLSGAYVLKPIKDDITPLINIDLDSMGEFAKAVRTVEIASTSAFKIGKVALNPPTMVRNALSGFIQNNMRGRSLPQVVGDAIEAANHWGKGDKFWREAQAKGLYESNFSTGEVKEILDVLNEIDPSKVSSIWSNFMKVAKFYGKIDDFNKYAIYRQMRKDGADTAEALREAQKWGMDYSLASRSVKQARRHAIPFLTYQYKVAPLVLESLKKRPWVIGKYMTVFPVMAGLAAEGLKDVSLEDWEEAEKNLPEYMLDQLTWTIYPWKDEDGRVGFVNTEYFFPWGSLMGMWKDLTEGDMKGASKNLSLINPVISIAATFTGGREGKPPTDMFTGQPIYGKLDSPSEQWTKVASYIVNFFMPSAFTSRGASGKAVRAFTGESDRWGKEVSTTQAMAAWGGVNINFIDPRQTAASRGARIQELKRNFASMLKQPSVREDKEKVTELRKRLVTQIREIHAEKEQESFALKRVKEIKHIGR